MSREPYDEQTQATAEQGEVMLDGPNGMALSMTPAAATRTADLIRTAAVEAVAQSRKIARS